MTEKIPKDFVEKENIPQMPTLIGNKIKSKEILEKCFNKENTNPEKSITIMKLPLNNKDTIQEQEKSGKIAKWPIACGFCPQIFPSLEEQIAHKIEFHLDISLPYQCSECGSWWKSRKNLLKHMIDSHKKYKIYVCTFCKPVKQV